MTDTRSRPAVQQLQPEQPIISVQPLKKEARAFERLHALVRKGYKAEIGTDTPSGGIVLRHLGKAPDLMLHPDGSVEPLEGRIPRHKRKVADPGSIAAGEDADQVRFLKFIETVKRPSLRDRSRPWRKKYFYVPAVLIAICAMSLLFSLFVVNVLGG